MLFLSELFLWRHQVIKCWCNYCSEMADIKKSSRSSSFSKCYLCRPKSQGYLKPRLNKLPKKKAPLWFSAISSLWTELVSSNWISYARSVDKGSSEHISNILVSRITLDIKLINVLDTKKSLQLLFTNIQNVECVL